MHMDSPGGIVKENIERTSGHGVWELRDFQGPSLAKRGENHAESTVAHARKKLHALYNQYNTTQRCFCDGHSQSRSLVLAYLFLSILDLFGTFLKRGPTIGTAMSWINTRTYFTCFTVSCLGARLYFKPLLQTFCIPKHLSQSTGLWQKVRLQFVNPTDRATPINIKYSTVSKEVLKSTFRQYGEMKSRDGKSQREE